MYFTLDPEHSKRRGSWLFYEEHSGLNLLRAFPINAIAATLGNCFSSTVPFRLTPCTWVSAAFSPHHLWIHGWRIKFSFLLLFLPCSDSWSVTVRVCRSRISRFCGRSSSPSPLMVLWQQSCSWSHFRYNHPDDLPGRFDHHGTNSEQIRLKNSTRKRVGDRHAISIHNHQDQGMKIVPRPIPMVHKKINPLFLFSSNIDGV